MGFNKAYVEGSMYNLVTIEECFQNPSLYDRDNAVIINYRGIDVILPIRVRIFDRTLVGVYPFYNDQPIASAVISSCGIIFVIIVII